MMHLSDVDGMIYAKLIPVTNGYRICFVIDALVAQFDLFPSGK